MRIYLSIPFCSYQYLLNFLESGNTGGGGEEERPGEL